MEEGNSDDQSDDSLRRVSRHDDDASHDEERPAWDATRS